MVAIFVKVSVMLILVVGLIVSMYKVFYRINRTQEGVLWGLVELIFVYLFSSIFYQAYGSLIMGNSLWSIIQGFIAILFMVIASIFALIVVVMAADFFINGLPEVY